MNRAIVDIVEDWLRTHGFSGLYFEDDSDWCGCFLGDLAPCGELGDYCRPGYAIKDPDHPEDLIGPWCPDHHGGIKVPPWGPDSATDEFMAAACALPNILPGPPKRPAGARRYRRHNKRKPRKPSAARIAQVAEDYSEVT